MFRVLKIAGAFVGVIVGAGFASGQEVLQYFTSFGLKGTFAAILATALFAYLGMVLANIGSRLKAQSHKSAIYEISGRYLGVIVDAIIIFTLFGVGVVMIAGAGSTVNQQFGLPVFVGSLLMTVLVTLAMMLKVDKVIGVIASITPFLLIFIGIISVYSLSTMDASFAALDPVTDSLEKSFPNWFISAVNYVSFNIAVGAGMALLTGGAEKNPRLAGIGGLLGGLAIGIMIIFSHLAIFAQIETVASYDLPLLKMVEDISPILAVLMAIVLFGMIFNTALGMFYGFVARFFEMDTKKARIATVITLAIGFVLSFVGFTTLVSKFYSLIGYLGLFLILALVYAPIKLKREGK
ncbi:putative membrane protein [Bhargavaea cecembensis DSE10]|uniref:Putative membrane protein n=1 Tax=Bhargavaea cecembensis DSE10 TaxID=1235279 RepID=M7NUR8_9BACL|nr:membrane protein [Bhargavaea cecembensis]EMR05400.1 putative membrane protein [Bhargavaea cecembensis DSE10]